jgi:hypothetical protein
MFINRIGPGRFIESIAHVMTCQLGSVAVIGAPWLESDHAPLTADQVREPLRGLADWRRIHGPISGRGQRDASSHSGSSVREAAIAISRRK